MCFCLLTGSGLFPPNSDSETEPSDFATVRTIWLTYAFFYLGRVNISPVLPALALSLGVGRAEVGILGTAFFWVYALGQFVNGQLGSFLSPRRMIALGLLVIALVNIAFAFQTSLLVMVLLWALNGFAQSSGWPPMLRIIAERFDRERMKRISSIMPVSYVVGTAVTWIVVGLLAAGENWQIAFWLPGCFMLGVLVFWWRAGIDAPSAKGRPFRLSAALPEMRSVWYVLVGSSLGGFVYIGGLIWLPSYVADMGFVPATGTGALAAVLQVISLPGIFIARYWMGRSGSVLTPTIGLLLSAMVCMLGAALTGGVLSFVVLCVAFLAMNGATGMMTSAVPLALSAVGRASSMTGTVNALSNFGGGMAGIVVGALAESSGWSAVFLMWAIAAAIAAITLWFHREQEQMLSQAT